MNKEVCGIIDLVPTISNVTGANVPTDRIIDGKNILPPMRSADAKSPHEALLAMSGGNPAVVCSGKWKLRYRSPGPEPRAARDASKWVDPRGPDGVTLLAPCEQARPDRYPGVQTGGPRHAPRQGRRVALRSDSEPAETVRANCTAKS